MGLFSSSGSDASVGIALRRIEAKLDLIMQNLGIEPPPTGQDDDLRELRDGGRAIEAIKLYRERHGVGLAEAKRAVEGL